MAKQRKKQTDEQPIAPPPIADIAKMWPADQVERRPVGSLLAYALNSRLHSPEQVEQIAKAIGEFGWTIPILVDEDGVIIAGHGRIQAAAKLGIADVPVMVARGWTEDQKRAYRIWDNQAVILGAWDVKALQMELRTLASTGYDLALTGFDDVHLASFLAGSGGADPERVPEPRPDAVSVRGDIWVLGNHRVMCGSATDATEVRALLAGAKAPTLMVTDPPYGVDYDPMWRNRVKRRNGTLVGAKATGIVNNDDQADWRDAWALFPGDVIYCWHGGLQSSASQIALSSAGFQVRAQIIWNKQQKVIGRGDYHWQHEPCWYAVRKGKPGRWAGDRTQSTVWDIDAPSGWRQATEGPDAHTMHSTQKPIECMRRPIVNSSRAGEAVYDPFLGSGTTMMAAELTARTCLGMELDPVYVDVAVRRWQEFTGKEARHAELGLTWAAAADSRGVIAPGEENAPAAAAGAL